MDVDSRTAIGIGVVVGSNALISLALNLQKLAHRRLGNERPPAPTPSPVRTPRGTANGNGLSKQRFMPSTTVILEAADERQPLLNARPPLRTAASSPRAPQTAAAISPRRASSLANTRSSRAVPKAAQVLTPAVSTTDDDQALVVEAPAILTVPVASSPRQSGSLQGSTSQSRESLQDGTRESDYLRSRLWWSAFLLMNIGEFGNFLSYAYAPASVIAPLGASALIANCFFSPLILHEKFRKRDILGIFLTVLGALTIVSAAKSTDKQLDPDALIAALKQRVFIIYSAICASLAALLIWLSETSAGDRFIFIDIGICALLGGFTVLSTKATSTLVSLYGFGVFALWLTYPTLIVLLVTGVGQVKYLNRALMRFDSKAVIPSQFVGFNLAVITGSAILYRDFEDVTFHRFLSFMNGCAMTFLGVWVLATRANVVSDEGDEENHLENSEIEANVASPVDLERGRAHDQSTSRAISVPVLLRKKGSAPALGLSPGQHLLVASTWDGSNSVRGTRDSSVSTRRRTVPFG